MSIVQSRRRMDVERESVIHKFNIGQHEGYIIAGMYPDGSLGEVFLNGIGKEGSTIKGLMDAWAISLSIGLQYGVPLKTFADKFTNMKFDPEGDTENPEIPLAKSMPDYIMKWLMKKFGEEEVI
jgi:ribonucleoside-diphosphate reductase alpha chain